MMDLKKAIKEYKKLGVPSNLYDPTRVPFNTCKYFMILSERSSGKTTNVLLFGLILNKLYGTVIQYIRQFDLMLAPKNARALMDTIITHKYIEKITEEKYNSAVYKSRRWYYCKIEGEEIKETALEPFMVCLSIDNNETYKSSYNAPLGDFVIFDEFCASRHAPNEFVNFCDLLKTIFRNRTEGFVWLLGNTIDRYEYYFDEMEVSEYIPFMKIGENMSITTSRGTGIYVELYKPTKTNILSDVNRLFFGFSNSRLNAITGENWLIEPYQHIDTADEREILNKSHFIIYEKNILQLEVCNSEKYGLHVVVHKSTNENAHGTYYTINHLHDIRFRYRYGYSNIDRMIWTLYDRQKFFYATNSAAAIMKKYVSAADKATL